jgi:hypothetical protein
MTDVPAAAAAWATLAAGAAALGRRPIDGRALAVALAIGCLGFSVREFAIAAPAAVLLAVLVAEPRRPRHWLAAGAVVAVLLALRWWRVQLPGAPGGFAPVPGVAGQLIPAATTLGFVLAPAALVAALRWHRVWRWRDVAIGAGLAVLALAIRGKLDLGDVLLDNLMSAYGVPAPDYLIGGRPRLFALPSWSVVGAVGLGAFVIFGAATGGIAGTWLRWLRSTRTPVREWLGSKPGLLALFVIGLAAGLAVFGTYRWLYDRYLWPLVPPLAVLLLHHPPALGAGPEARSAASVDKGTAPLRRGGALDRVITLAAGLSLAGLLALSAIFLLNSDAFDAARWRAAESLVARGYPAESVDAGPEWVGSHPTGTASADRPLTGPVWWQTWWPSFHMCAFVASTPQTDPRYRLLETRERAYRLYLVVGAWKALYLYAVDDPACPAGLASPISGRPSP